MKIYQILLFFLLIPFYSSSQSKVDSLINNFNERSQIPEENIHLHLNKSVYVKGEDIGYTAYVIDQRTKKPSLATTNLYVQLLNDQLDVVDEKLLLVEGGISTHVFETDSLTVAGNYTIKGFTNWMRNFDQPLFAQQPLKIVDPDISMDSLQVEKDRKFELSILPEGGHAVDGVFVKMGAILKDQNGYGVSATGNILKNGEKISKFSLDENGIGSFLFLPDAESEYKFSIELPEQQVERSGLKIEDKGVSIAVAESQSKVYVNLRTNDKTLEDRRGEEFIVAINDHQNIKVFKVSLKDYENLLAIERDSLTAGMNQISYFTQRGVHLGDRLYFNREGLNTNQESKVSLSRQLDSLNVNLEFKGISKASSSVSVLPGQSKALPQNHIISDFYLSPYVKGNIQDPSQYFDKNDRATDFALDNLLLTQGWSMHDWRMVFENNTKFSHSWEQGITLFGGINSQSIDQILLLPGRLYGSQIISLEKNKKEFTLTGLLPLKNEGLRFTAQDSKGNAEKLNLYTRFFPNKIPIFSSNTFFRPILSLSSITSLKESSIEEFRDAETLGEVIINFDRPDQKQKKITARSTGTVDFFDDNDRKKYINIEQYLRQNGYTVRFSRPDEGGDILNIRALSGRVAGPPIVVLNDQPFFTTDVLVGLDMSLIEYIELDNSGLSKWARGLNPFGRGGSTPSPVIAISFDPTLSPYKKNKKAFSDLKVPLTFETPQEYYAPAYTNYNSNFFKNLGVIDWQGRLQVENGKAKFSMPYVGQNTMWFIIEGMAEDGTLIYSFQQASILR